MNRTYTAQDKLSFNRNRSTVANSLKSIENSVFARTNSYLDDIVNSDNSTNNKQTHALTEKLLAGIEDELTPAQREMYAKFLYCAFICLERNILPSFENIIALAANTECSALRGADSISADLLAKDKFLPRFGLSGIAERLRAMMNDEALPLEEYSESEPDYLDFCKQFGFGAHCRALGQDFTLSAEDSDEAFEKYRNNWDEAVSMTIPDADEFFETYDEFMKLFGEGVRFRASDIEKMVDIYLFTKGKSVLSTTSSRLSKLLGDLQKVDSDFYEEHSLLEMASNEEEIAIYDEGISNFDILNKQEKWINDTTRYIKDMLSGMNINFI
ncbi:MAG: hypothetical protein ACI4Q4_06795, partial [Oscillospiraceae bacterium]